jgi:hypothetical protein
VDQYNDKARGIASATRVVRSILPEVSNFEVNHSPSTQTAQRSRDHGLNPNDTSLCLLASEVGVGGWQKLLGYKEVQRPPVTTFAHMHTHARDGTVVEGFPCMYVPSQR